MSGSTRRKALLGGSIIGLAVLAASLAIIEQRTRREVTESVDWVAHTMDVTREFQIALTLMDDAETGQRGFLLTGNDMYLDPYDRARGDVATRIARLRTLTAENPSQQSRLAQLEPLISDKLAELSQTIGEARIDQRENALRTVQSNSGQRLMDGIRANIKLGIDDEERLLVGRQAQLTMSIRRRSLVMVVLSLIVLAAIGVIVWLGLRLERVRAFVTLCAWSQSVEYEGAWISFEQYLQRRFNLKVTLGMSPDEAARFLEEHGDPRR